MQSNWDEALFIVMRHGRTEANDRKIYRSWSNAKEAQLNQEGRDDAAEAAEYLLQNEAQVKVILCDSLDRTLETGEIVRDILGADDLVPVRGLHPLNMGDWTLTPKDEHPAEKLWENTSFVVPGGESLDQFNSRQFDAFKWIFKFCDDLPPGSVLVLGHGSNISFLHNHVFNGDEKKIGYEGLVDPGGLVLASSSGLQPLTNLRGEEETGKKISATQAGYMELAGAKKDAGCKIVAVPGGVSTKLGCCNEFKPQGKNTDEFRCGECRFVLEEK